LHTKTPSIISTPLDRRQLLKLATASILVVTGCASTRGGSGLDAAVSELGRLTEEMDGKEQQRITAIVQRIQEQANGLADEHRSFTDSFDRLLAANDATETQLQQLVENYNDRRVLKRNELLHLQDELHAAMRPEDWAEIVRALNRAGKSLAGYTLSGS
jgi:uncharacterized protein YlxW (UPF0749 family)